MRGVLLLDRGLLVGIIKYLLWLLYLKGQPEACIVNQVVQIMWLLYIIYSSGRPLSSHASKLHCPFCISMIFICQSQSWCSIIIAEGLGYLDRFLTLSLIFVRVALALPLPFIHLSHLSVQILAGPLLRIHRY